jgi:hypothetical protein
MPLPTNSHEIYAPRLESVWKWPAIVNMAVGPAAAGLFMFTVAFIGLYSNPHPEKLRLMLLAAPAIMLIGLGAVGMEIGKFRHIAHILSNAKTSWMSREVLVAAAFVLFAAAAAITTESSGWLLFAGSAAAGAFIFSQAMIVRKCLAIRLWGRPLVIVFFFSSALASGFALFIVACSFLVIDPHHVVFWSGLLCIALNGAVWAILVWSPAIMSIPAFGSTAAMTLLVGFGHIIPLLLMATGRLFSMSAGLAIPPLPVMLAGAACILAGTFLQKRALIRYGCISNGMPLQCDAAAFFDGAAHE